MQDLLHRLLIAADTTSAVQVVRDYAGTTLTVLAGIASLASTFFLVHGGYLYITSRGSPDGIVAAKKILRNALIGLVIVLGAATLTTLLSSAYGHPPGVETVPLPALESIEPGEASSGLVEVLIAAVTGFLANIIQTISAPFLSALDYFTKETPLMSSNPGVFNLWLAMVGITNVLFILIIALIGFHVMSATSFGFNEPDLKHLLPRIGLVFLLLNASIFIIDMLIELSNVLIAAIAKLGGTNSVWTTLTSVAGESGGQSAAALLLMLAFIIFSVILLVYYIGRLVTLFLGAVLSPLVVVLWLVPSFKDFSVSAIKTYITTVFVLFVHVITLQLASTLFAGMSAGSGNDTPNIFMSMLVGIATVITLLKTQGVMMQFSYVSLGANNARKLGSQFINGISYMSGVGKTTSPKFNTNNNGVHRSGGFTSVGSSNLSRVRMSNGTGGLSKKSGNDSTNPSSYKISVTKNGITQKDYSPPTGPDYQSPRMSQDNISSMPASKMHKRIGARKES